MNFERFQFFLQISRFQALLIDDFSTNRTLALAAVGVSEKGLDAAITMIIRTQK